MASRRDFYHDTLDDAARSPSTNLEQVFKDLFLDVDGRITATEESLVGLNRLRDDTLQAVLDYNKDKLEPEFDRVRVAADLGLLFEAHSATSLSVGTGEKEIIIDVADRGRFSAPGFVGIMRKGFPGTFMAGRRISYDKASGTLKVSVSRVSGSGTFADWDVMAVSGTDYAAAAGEAQAHAGQALVYRDEARSARDAAQDHVDDANLHKSGALAAQSAAELAAAGAAISEDLADQHLQGVLSVAANYLGPSATNPATRPDGSALETGNLYWNTAAAEMRIFDGTNWVVAYVPGSSTVVSWNGRTGGVSPADGDYTAAQVVVSPSILGTNRVQAALASLQSLADGKLSASAVSAFILSLLDDANATDARATLGAAAAAHQHDWSDLTSGVPGTISALAGGTGTDGGVWVYGGAASGSMVATTAFGRSLWAAADAAAARTTLGAASDTHGHGDVVAGGASGFMTGADKTKLNGIATGANNYVHPTGDGSLHVPATGTTNNGKVLKSGATAGSIAWGTVSYSELGSIPAAVSAIGSLTPAADKIGYYSGAGTAALADFTSIGRSVVGAATAEAARSAIGAASSTHSHGTATGSASGFMSTTDKTKLDGIEDGANAYVHPSTDGTLHVPATGTTNNHKVLKAGATAGTFSWAQVAYSELTGVPQALATVGGLTPAADRLPYYTGPSGAALATFTNFGRSLVAAADAAAARTLIGASGGNIQQFDTSGTWSKPSGFTDDAPVLIRVWGGGGSGSKDDGAASGRAGGGGGGYAEFHCKLGYVPSSVTVTVGAGGAARATNGGGSAGGNTTFGTYATGYGGAGASSGGAGGGGGGWMGAASGSTGGAGAVSGDTMFGGRNGDNGTGASGYFGGGAGAGGNSSAPGGNSVFGGAGGASRSNSVSGTSVFGGNGGVLGGGAGQAPGGGGAGAAAGGSSGPGGDGRCIVIVYPG